MQSLSEEARIALLDLARRSVSEVVFFNRPVTEVPLTGIFAEKRGVFVTLHVRGRLRGCIGIVEAYEPLGTAIAHCAAGAALHDPRFPPLRAEELAELQIEISLLSPPEPLRAENIEIGKHGLLISHGTSRGLLLPQVALEHRLSCEQFLQETCRKAGLPTDAWKNPEIQLFGFFCEVFSDAPRGEGRPAS